MVKTLMTDGTVKIEISVELYNSMREYCDQNGYRFIEFIEDSLESATYRDELERFVNDEVKIKERIENERVESIQRGFIRGVMAATFTMKGYSGLGESLTPKEIKKSYHFIPVQGEQIKMFK
jgi:oligoendopeptidase F